MKPFWQESFFREFQYHDIDPPSIRRLSLTLLAAYTKLAVILAKPEKQQSVYFDCLVISN